MLLTHVWVCGRWVWRWLSFAEWARLPHLTVAAAKLKAGKLAAIGGLVACAGGGALLLPPLVGGPPASVGGPVGGVAPSPGYRPAGTGAGGSPFFVPGPVGGGGGLAGMVPGGVAGGGLGGDVSDLGGGGFADVSPVSSIAGVPPVDVPEPGSAGLLLGGVASLACWRSMRKETLRVP